MQTKWEVKRGATVRFPDISSRFTKCCTYLYPHFDMVHLFHPTFPNGVYEIKTKWEVNRGATFCFPDTSSRFAKCCTNLDPHFDMVYFFHPTFANGDSSMFNLVTCSTWQIYTLECEYQIFYEQNSKIWNTFLGGIGRYK